MLFVRSIDRVEREAIGIELEEDDGANGLTEDWSKVERVCQRLSDGQADKARQKARDGAPSPQEEGERKRDSARLDFGAGRVEVYVALKEMLEDEERMRPQADTEETSSPCEMAEDWYDRTTEEGAERNALSVCREERPGTRPRIRS